MIAGSPYLNRLCRTETEVIAERYQRRLSEWRVILAGPKPHPSLTDFILAWKSGRDEH